MSGQHSAKFKLQAGESPASGCKFVTQDSFKLNIFKLSV